MPSRSRYSDASFYQTYQYHPETGFVTTSGHTDFPSVHHIKVHYDDAVYSDNDNIIEVRESTDPVQIKSTTYPIKSAMKQSPPSVSSSATESFSTNSKTSYSSLPKTSQTRSLYFAYGTDLSPTSLRRKINSSSKSSTRPIAVAKLRDWQWIISARGVPNIVPLPITEVCREKGEISSSRRRDTDASVVYGLIYNLNSADELQLDTQAARIDYEPFNMNLGLDRSPTKSSRRHKNVVIKHYERVEVVEWLCDPTSKRINLSPDTRSVKCMVYSDDSDKGLRPGRICTDAADALSLAVTIAVRNHGLSRRWAENVMEMHGIYVLRKSTMRMRNSDDTNERCEKDRSGKKEARVHWSDPVVGVC